MNNEIPMVMTIEETSVYLRIPKSTLYKIAQEGKIPCQKVGRHWRFHRESLDRWLQENPNKELSPAEETVQWGSENNGPN
jgi:excisionase family DNA binding protein